MQGQCFRRNAAHRPMLLGTMFGVGVVIALCWLLFTTAPVANDDDAPVFPPPPPQTRIATVSPAPVTYTPVVDADEDLCGQLANLGCTWRDGFKCDGWCARAVARMSP
jgi:hypothetical protein